MGFAADVQATRSTLTSVDTTLSEAITATQDYIPVASTTNFSTSVVAEIESTNEVVSFTDISENLFTYSEQLDNAVWANPSSIVSPNALIAPNGTLTADKLIAASTGPGRHYIRRAYTGLPNSRYTFSIYAKAGEFNGLMINAKTDVYCWIVFNLSTGTVESPQQNADATGEIESVGDGWYRCTWRSVNPGTSPEWSAACGPAGSGFSGMTFVGNDVDGIYVWGNQMESTAVTEYLPTTTTALVGLTGVTRGVNGTTAQAASSGASIQQLPYALGSLDLPIRLKALSVSSDGNGAGRLTLCDNNGDSLCDVDFANDTIYTLTIPEDGIIFPNGIFVSNTDNVEAYTLYTDNFSNPGLTAG